MRPGPYLSSPLRPAVDRASDRLGRWRFALHTALLAMPGLALLLAGGVIFDMRTPASIAAGAAFSIGFGAEKHFRGSRWATMLLTAAGMVAAGFLGTVLGRDPLMTLVATAAMGGVCGALARWNITAWWMWLQVVIAFLIAGHFPGDAADGLHRALLVAAGAGVQLAAVGVMLALIGPGRPPPPRPADPASPRDIRLHALRAATCIAAAVLAARTLGIMHGYWAPMTAMIVLKPGLRDTGFRGFERIGGTLAGIGLATALLYLLPAGSLAIVAAAVLIAGCAFALQQARYALLSTAITASVVLMIAIAGYQPSGAEKDRILATLVGGAVALAGAAIAPHRASWRRRAGDRD